MRNAIGFKLSLFRIRIFECKCSKIERIRFKIDLASIYFCALLKTDKRNILFSCHLIVMLSIIFCRTATKKRAIAMALAFTNISVFP